MTEIPVIEKTTPVEAPVPAEPEMTGKSAEEVTLTTPPSASESSTAPTTTAQPEISKEQAPELQNALTEKFTDAEWTALKAFRTKLPEIFTNAYGPENPDYKPAPITLWGVPIDPANPASDARTSVILIKFLRARELKVNEAAAMLTGTLRWREEMNIDGIMKEEFNQNVFGKVGYIFGKDREGRPVVYNIYGGNDVNTVFADVQTFIRWRIQFQEKSIQLLDFETVDQTTQVHDYEGVSMTSRTPNQKAAASEATNIFQSHYPELLARKFFINVPTLLSWVFWAFKAVVSSATFAKLTMVGTSHHAIHKALVEVIEPKELPKRYGGEADAF